MTKKRSIKFYGNGIQSRKAIKYIDYNFNNQNETKLFELNLIDIDKYFIIDCVCNSYNVVMIRINVELRKNERTIRNIKKDEC